MRIRLVTKILVLILLTGGTAGGFSLVMAQTITPATGGTGISADNFATGTWTTLNGPIISETSPGQLTSGNIRLNAPSGFEWDTGGTAPTATVTQPKGNQITVTFQSRSASQVVFSVEGNSGGQPPNNPHAIEFGDLRIRPLQGSLEHGEIRNVGSAAPGGTTNYGTISMQPGAEDRMRVESAPNSGGSIISSQEIEAGQTITVYSNVHDQFNNFIRNEPANWTLANISGGVTGGNLVPAGDNRSADFTAELVGSATIEASSGGLNIDPSGQITVKPSDPNELIILTEPTGASQAVTAGETFSPQPELAIVDEFGNKVSSANFTQVTAERLSGSGSLQGTTTISANNGLISFTDLSHTVANEISLRFSADGFSPITSQVFTVNPAAAESLIFLDDIPNGSRNTALSPQVEVQIIDKFDNPVPDENVSIELSLLSGSGSINGNSAATDAAGLAAFNNLQFNQTGSKTLQAASSDNSLLSPESDEFTISAAGELAGFRVEISGGGDIPSQTAGENFNLRVTAIDGAGNTLDGNQGRGEFNEYVHLTTTGLFSDDTDSTNIGPFNAGVYEPQSVSMPKAGEVRIRATNADPIENQSGNSNYFTVLPAAADPDSSYLTANPETLIADGVSESVITLHLKDQYGNTLGDDISEPVQLSLQTSNGGSLSPVSGNGDGTYSALLTASNDVGLDEIGASVDGLAVTSGNVTVQYSADELSTFRIEAAGGGNLPDQTAGQPFAIQISALDEFNNIVNSFDGTVEITSDQAILSGEGTTINFTDGVLSTHAISLETAGAATLSARLSGSSERGTSSSFTVNPAGADPEKSQITAARSFLQNDGEDNTTITVQLRDEFRNNLLMGGSTVTLSTTGGTLSGVTDQNDGTYTAVLTAGTTIETALVTGSVNSTEITDNEEVFISQFNRWTSGASGPQSNKSDWSNTGNWSLGSLPTTDQIVLIPSEKNNGDPLERYPIISDDNDTEINPVVDFMVIEQGANITVSDRTLTIREELSGAGSLFANNSIINLGGDVNLSNFIAGSSDIFFNGNMLQTINGDFTGNNLNIINDVTVNGYFESFTSVNIEDGQTLLLDSGSQFVVLSNLNIDGTLWGNESIFTIGGDINGSDILLTDTELTFNGETPQAINGIETLKKFIINNPTLVSVHNDLVITDTLTITQGELAIHSGFNLATNVTTGQAENIRMYRDIGDGSGSSGWRLLTPPLQSTYQNFFDQTLTQGFENSSLGMIDSNGDSLQPNVLFYDETIPGTDNQRWRRPHDAASDMTTARGYFVYFFGDDPNDSRYNDPFPHTLDVIGAENTGNGSEIDLPVTYTAEADTGWNLVGNPYTATVDWDDGTWDKTNVSNSIYVWDENTNQYLTWNGISGSLNGGKIAPFQGFWVKANGQGTPSLKVRKESKTTGGIFHKENSRQDEEWPVLELRVDGAGMNHSTFFTFSKEGRNNIDDLDAYRLLPFDTNSYLEIFTLLKDGTELAINSLPRKFGKPIELPVHVTGVKEGQFLNEDVSLSWPQMKNIPNGWRVILTDTRTGKKVNLKQEHFYDFGMDSRAKSPPPKNTPQNFRLVEKSKSKIQSARFIITIDPGSDAEGVPDEVVLHQNFPNPFRQATTIEFGLPVEGNARIDLYDVIGRRVQTLTDQRYEAGYHQTQLDARSLASGVYIYRLITSDKIVDKKMVFIK